LDRSGERWVVVAMMDGKSLNTWSAHAVQDALLAWVYQGAVGTLAKDAPAAMRADIARRGR
jgi:hypothetical protein